MVTYLFWFAVIAVVIASITVIGKQFNQWKAAFITGLVLLVTCAALYFFWLEQMLVKSWGGVMSINQPVGQQHLGATWKDNNLWIESYDPTTNTCHFREYSRGHMLEGAVVIKDCNPFPRP